jgi:hypothetical protein
MHVNLSIPDEQNEERKKINATWRTVITAGLAALQKKTVESEKLPPAVESHLKQALKNLGDAWKLVKPFMGE